MSTLTCFIPSIPTGFRATTAKQSSLSSCPYHVRARHLNSRRHHSGTEQYRFSNCTNPNFSTSPQQLESCDQFHPVSPSPTYSLSESVTDSTLNPAFDSGTGDGVGSEGGAGGKGYGNGGNGGSSGGGEDSDEFLPDDMKAALAYGSLSRDALQRYYESIRNPLLRTLLSVPAFRSRFLMDSQFLFKLLVQEVVGNGTSLAGEIVVRGRDIVHELEYVASDLIVGTVIEAAFVWLLAPTMTLPASPNASPISRYLSRLPAHVFQPSTAVQSFTFAQRFVSFFYTAGQYAAIGFVGGVVGTAITYALLESRKLVDKGYKPMRPMPPVIPNAAGWAAFMGFSCNTRFQLVEGLEMGVAKLLSSKSESLVSSAIVALRFINNYYGGVQFVQFFRAIGLHATGEHEEDGDGKKAVLETSTSESGSEQASPSPNHQP